jgi:hypothetical protein
VNERVCILCGRKGTRRYRRSHSVIGKTIGYVCVAEGACWERECKTKPLSSGRDAKAKT